MRGPSSALKDDELHFSWDADARNRGVTCAHELMRITPDKPPVLSFRIRHNGIETLELGVYWLRAESI